MTVLDRVEIALNDWVHTYAPEFCDDKTVEETRARIVKAGGTLAYIADTLELVRAAKKLTVGTYIKVEPLSVDAPTEVLVCPPI